MFGDSACFPSRDEEHIFSTAEVDEITQFSD